MNAPASIVVTPVLVADLHVEGERMPVYVHVIDHPDARVLVDTGMTELHPAMADMDPRLQPLSGQDVDLAGIDIVVNTHLHADHAAVDPAILDRVGKIEGCSDTHLNQDARSAPNGEAAACIRSFPPLREAETENARTPRGSPCSAPADSTAHGLAKPIRARTEALVSSSRAGSQPTSKAPTTDAGVLPEGDAAWVRLVLGNAVARTPGARTAARRIGVLRGASLLSVQARLWRAR
jgi:Metallo-beta-lactamase superfamily